MKFADRRHAGRFLASKLQAYRGMEALLVLALPRGGVPVGYEVARALGAPLDVYVVRKLGVPGYEEYAMGAIASGDVCVVNADVLELVPHSSDALEDAIAREREELQRRERAYREDRPFPSIEGRPIIVVDDGLATGSSMRAAVTALREQAPQRIVVGVPVASPDICAELGHEVDDIICASTPDPLQSVGSWYEDFAQTEDAEVRALLSVCRGASATTARPRTDR